MMVSSRGAFCQETEGSFRCMMHTGTHGLSGTQVSANGGTQGQASRSAVLQFSSCTGAGTRAGVCTSFNCNSTWRILGQMLCGRMADEWVV